MSEKKEKKIIRKPIKKLGRNLDTTDFLILDLIKKAEHSGSVLEKGHEYSTSLANKDNPTGVYVSGMENWSINKVIEYASKHGASGAYQFTAPTLTELRDKLKLTGEEIFNKDLQDELGIVLATIRGYDDWRAGNLSDEEFLYSFGHEWAGLPALDNGDSAYEGVGTNSSTIQRETALQALKNIKETDKAGIKSYEEYDNLNKKRSLEYSSKIEDENHPLWKTGRSKDKRSEAEKIHAEYFEKYKEIQEKVKKDPSISFDNELYNLHYEYFKQGNLGIIMDMNSQMNDRRYQLLDIYPEWEKLSSSQRLPFKNKEEYDRKREAAFRSSPVTATDGGSVIRTYYNAPGPNDYPFPIQVNPALLELKIDEENKAAINNYVQNLQDDPNASEAETNPLVQQATQAANDISEGNVSETESSQPSITEDIFSTDIEPVNFMPYEKGNAVQSLLSSIPGIAIGLTTGLAGMDAANQSPPERDESVSDALLNYASQLRKISQMGLDPEIEGKLKNDLASAYQVGLENIVRASAGNRNLVLGNQGQLDQSRMESIMDMALLDLDRRDKAMMAYGEVMQYINEFDKNRDIANNERQYREFEKRQLAGSQVAQQGFSKIIDELTYQQQNGPGSANDMLKQYLHMSIFGYADNVPDDHPYSKKSVEAKAQRIRDLNSEKEKASSYASKLNKEEKDEFFSFIEQNPQYNPNVNKEFRFDDLLNAMSGGFIQEEKKDLVLSDDNTDKVNETQNNQVLSKKNISFGNIGNQDENAQNQTGFNPFSLLMPSINMSAQNYISPTEALIQEKRYESKKELGIMPKL